jgi:hypothetical protein
VSNAPEDIKTSIEIINRYASMPSNARFEQGVLERLMASVGFEDIQVNDLSLNIPHASIVFRSRLLAIFDCEALRP